MLISACVIAIGFGLGCFFDKELIWSLYEYDAQLMGKMMRKAPGWENLLNIQGAVFILIGLLGIIVALR
jgi:preprotein translocase subunit Sss1